MKFLDKKKWAKDLNVALRDLSDADIMHFINQKITQSHDFESSAVIEEAFTVALARHKKDLAQLIYSELAQGKNKIDVGMMNFRVHQMDLKSLQIYSELVDMTQYHGDDGDFTRLYVAKGKLDCVLLSIDKGMENDPTKFFEIAVENQLFDDADYYLQNMTVSFKKKEWDKFLGRIVFNFLDKDAIETLEYLDKKDLGHPMCGNNSIAVMTEACTNMNFEAMKYLHGKGAVLSHRNADKDPMALGWGSSELIDWLLEQGVEPIHGAKILKLLSHQKESEQTMLNIIGKMDKKKVPWGEMLSGAVGAGPGVVINRLKFFFEHHEFSNKEITKAYRKALSYGHRQAVNYFEEQHDFFPGFAELKAAAGDKFDGVHNKLVPDLIEKGIDVTKEDNWLLYEAVEQIISRGGRSDIIEKILSAGASPYARDGKLLSRVKDGLREDIKVIFNNYLQDKDKFELASKEDYVP